MFRWIPRKKGRIITYLWMLAIVVSSAVPKLPGSGAVPYFHEFGHFFQFFVLVALFLAFFTKTKTRSFLYVLLFATIIEIHQYFLPWRAFELLDLLIDALGTTAGLAAHETVLNKIQNKLF